VFRGIEPVKEAESYDLPGEYTTAAASCERDTSRPHGSLCCALLRL